MKKSLLHLIVFVIASLLISCKKNDNTTSSLPVINTVSITNFSVITGTTATFNASISSEGASAILAKGVCWSKNQNPTISDNKTSNRQGFNSSVSKTNNGSGNTSFTANITGLTPHTTYYLRVYATNNSGTSYSNQIPFTTSGGQIMMDIDSNVYSTVTIGTQVWMKENLKTSKYRNGDPIPTGLSDNDWKYNRAGAYSIFNNDPANNLTYGKLYTWYAVSDSRNICPLGWHVPNETDWNILVNYLGGEIVAGAKMKDTTMWLLNTGTEGTNSSGFTGLPAGNRAPNGAYVSIGLYTKFWSTQSYDSINADLRSLDYNSNRATKDWMYKNMGYPVRCVKD